ncbi:MAG: membrane protein insertion efficiency factor YidD [Actinomycetota bacterium]
MTRALRRISWALGAPARAVLVAAIRLYRLLLSGWLGGQCRFYPSCSHYAEEAVRVHGAIKGTALAAWRIARCGPFTPGGVDRVPVPRREHDGYEGVTLAGRA